MLPRPSVLVDSHAVYEPIGCRLRTAVAAAELMIRTLPLDLTVSVSTDVEEALPSEPDQGCENVRLEDPNFRSHRPAIWVGMDRALGRVGGTS